MNAYIVIIDGLGIGAMADSAVYDSANANTLANLTNVVSLPNLTKLGLFSIFGVGEQNCDIMATYARGRIVSSRCDFNAGYNEILGRITYDNPLGIQSLDGGITDYNLINLLNDNDIVVSVIGNSGLDECFDSINCCNIIRRTELVGAADDITHYSAVMEDIDSMIGQLINNMDSKDLLIVTGNYGVSLDGKGKALREYSPVLFYMPTYSDGVDRGTIHGLDTIAMTVADYFGIYTSAKSQLAYIKAKHNVVKPKNISISLTPNIQLLKSIKRTDKVQR